MMEKYSKLSITCAFSHMKWFVIESVLASAFRSSFPPFRTVQSSWKKVQRTVPMHEEDRLNKEFYSFCNFSTLYASKEACAKAHCILLIIWRSPHQYSDFNSFTSRRFYMVISISTMSIQLQICSINIEINEFVSILRLRVHWLVSFTRQERLKKVFRKISLSRNRKDQVLSDFTSNSIEFVRAPL